MNGKIIGYFKKLGYRYSKDIQGHYFDKHDTRLSIMPIGAVWNCYCNRFINGQFMLIDKQPNLITDELVFQWMLKHVI